MGKKIIIKNVDFAGNAITQQWMLGLSNDNLVGNLSVSTNDVWYIQPEEVSQKNLTGKTIQFVKIYSPSDGVIKIGSTNGTSSWINDEYNVFAGINVVKLITPITLSSTTLIGFAGKDLIRMWYQGESGWLFNRRYSSTPYAPKTMPIDFGT